jgi:hypothetical protein
MSNETTSTKPATVGIGTSDLLAAVVYELKVLDKEIELMQLRIEEETEPRRKETLRSFGSCLWKHKKSLERAVAANKTAQP